MIKTAAKHNGVMRNRSPDAFCFVSEFITAPLYKRTLYDRAPIISAVESDDPDKVELRSKFLHNFQTIQEFTGGKLAVLMGGPLIGRESAKLGDVQGAEKVFASILAWGEFDMNVQNIGVMEVQDEAGRDNFVFAKIDHGWSATTFFTNPGDLLTNFANACIRYEYAEKIPLNVDKLKQSIDQITLISDDEIEQLVKARTHQLKQMGFELEELNFYFWEDDRSHLIYDPTVASRSFDGFDELETYYIDRLKRQIRVMREVSTRLDTIAKIDFNDKPLDQASWKNGLWLHAVRGEDPVAWAKRNRKTIEGLAPGEYGAQRVYPEPAQAT